MSAPTSPWKEGDPLEALVLPPVTRLDLIRYAGASGDYNPIHTMDEEAHRAGLPGVIQHGMLTMAQMGRLFSPHLEHGFLTRFQMRFRGMVFVGDSLKLSARVTGVDTTPEGERVTFDVTAETTEGRAIASGSAEFLWQGGGQG